MDYYTLLGIPMDATQDQIKAAYRKAIKIWHPDLNRNNISTASLMAAQLNEAYRVLMDPNERAIYNSKLMESRKKVVFEERKVYRNVRTEYSDEDSNNISRIKEVERIEAWKERFFIYISKHQWAAQVYSNTGDRVKNKIISGSSNLQDIFGLYLKLEEAKIRMGLSSAYFNLDVIRGYSNMEKEKIDVAFKTISSLEIILQIYIRFRSGLIKESQISTEEQYTWKKFNMVHKYLLKRPKDLFGAIQKFKIEDQDWEIALNLIR